MKNTDMAIEDSSIFEKFHAENYCGAGKTMISVGTDGNVYPCHMPVSYTHLTLPTTSRV